MTDQTIYELRRAVRDKAHNGGGRCPVCFQMSRVYRRTINAGMARSLAVMYRSHGIEWQKKTRTLAGLGAAARDESLLRYWELIEEMQEKREDGGRAGWWRVTRDGQRFVQNVLAVPKYAVVYDGTCLGLEGEPVFISDCIRGRFDLRLLLEHSA